MRLTILSWMVLLAQAVALNAQPAAAPPAGTVRQMSLNDCIRMALERNLTILVGDSVKLGDTADLDVQSEGKLGLQRSRLEMESLYGYYDPLFFSRYGQLHQDTHGVLDSTDLQNPMNNLSLLSRSHTWAETFELGLEGVLPTGTRYEVSANMLRTKLDDDPSPTVPSSVFTYESFAGITVTQPLLRDFWIDRGRVDIKLAKNFVKQSEFAFQLLVMDVVQKVSTTYFDFLAARDEIKVQEKALELANELVAENKRKAEGGAIAALEVRQSESQAATARADLSEAIFVAQQADNLLKALITHEFNTIQPVIIEPTEKLIAVFQAVSVAESWRNGLEQRPDYLIAKQEVESRDIALVYRKNQLYPALDLEGTYGRNGIGHSTSDSLNTLSDKEGFPVYGGFVVLSVPLTRKAERSNYKSAKVAQQSAVLSLKRKEDAVLQEIDIAVKEVISRYQTIESTRLARLYAEEALQAEQNKLENGRSTSYDVLLAQRDLTEAASAEISALANYNKALHQLYFREGTTLERNKIMLELR